MITQLSTRGQERFESQAKKCQNSLVTIPPAGVQTPLWEFTAVLSESREHDSVTTSEHQNLFSPLNLTRTLNSSHFAEMGFILRTSNMFNKPTLTRKYNVGYVTLIIQHTHTHTQTSQSCQWQGRLTRMIPWSWSYRWPAAPGWHQFCSHSDWLRRIKKTRLHIHAHIW